MTRVQGDAGGYIEFVQCRSNHFTFGEEVVDDLVALACPLPFDCPGALKLSGKLNSNIQMCDSLFDLAGCGTSYPLRSSLTDQMGNSSDALQWFFLCLEPAPVARAG